ncbi:MAG: hypothetical protein QOD28_3837, partial [Acidobacteriota bacterium]|nr:hypothetical protein [Acidobacteriota bacterium]
MLYLRTARRRGRIYPCLMLAVALCLVA